MNTVAVPDLYSYLLGSWRLERQLFDRASGAAGHFRGIVDFAAANHGLLQRESGTVVWPTHSGPASREYRWRTTTDPAVLAAYFTDDRPFHVVDLSRGHWSTEHWCAPDTYRVHYTATAQDRLDYEWDVRGPAKDLLLRTSIFRSG